MNVPKYEEWCGYYDPEEIELQLLLALCDFRSKDVLDVGCGTGRLSFRLLPFAKHVVGVDIDGDAIDVCFSKLRQSRLREKGTFIAADATSLQFSPGSFDVVVFSWSIYLLQNKAKLFSAVHDMLRNGGLVMIMQPVAGGFEETLCRFYRHSNLDAFDAHASEAWDTLQSDFTDCSSDILTTYFRFPSLPKAMEMVEFFIEDDDHRALTEMERCMLRQMLLPNVEPTGEVTVSDIVKVMTGWKANVLDQR